MFIPQSSEYTKVPYPISSLLAQGIRRDVFCNLPHLIAADCARIQRHPNKGSHLH